MTTHKKDAAKIEKYALKRLNPKKYFVITIDVKKNDPRRKVKKLYFKFCSLALTEAIRMLPIIKTKLYKSK
tara:strand:- start:140 stop:352 length:213 start_codon:yes stop_codon:yes gene_type:complete